MGNFQAITPGLSSVVLPLGMARAVQGPYLTRDGPNRDLLELMNGQSTVSVQLNGYGLRMLGICRMIPFNSASRYILRRQ